MDIGNLNGENGGNKLNTLSSNEKDGLKLHLQSSFLFHSNNKNNEADSEEGILNGCSDNKAAIPAEIVSAKPDSSQLVNSQLPSILDEYNTENLIKNNNLSHGGSPQVRYSSKSSTTVNNEVSQDRPHFSINVNANFCLPLEGTENPGGNGTLKVCETVEPRPLSKPEEYVIYKSMNFLPITTRYNMLRNGTKLKLVDVNPRQAVQITDTHPPEFSQKKCRVLKYVNVVSSDSCSSEGNSPKCNEQTTSMDHEQVPHDRHLSGHNNKTQLSKQQKHSNHIQYQKVESKATEQQFNIKEEKIDEQFRESDAAEVLLAMASGSMSNTSPANKSSITTCSMSPHSANLLNLSTFATNQLIKEEPIDTFSSESSLCSQEIKVDPNVNKPQYGIKANNFTTAPKISIISSKTTQAIPLNSPSINATKIYKIVSGGETSSSPTSAYITIIKRDKKDQAMKINKTISQTKSEPVLPSDPDFKAFAEAWHGSCADVAGNEIHKCTLCNKVYTVYEAFLNHIRVHYKQQNKCSVCGKTFTRSWLLKGHMRTHTGERPYACDFPGCEKAFADRSNLRSHTMIHKTKGKRYLCPMCDRAFAQKRYLHKHMAEVCKIPGCEQISTAACTSGSSNTQSTARYRTVLPKPNDSPSSTSSVISTDSQVSQ